MAVGNKFNSLFDSPKQLQEFQRKLTGIKYLTKGVLSQVCLFWPNPLIGVSLAGKICTRASAEPMHELKNTVISTDVFMIFVEVENLLLKQLFRRFSPSYD